MGSGFGDGDGPGTGTGSGIGMGSGGGVRSVTVAFVPNVHSVDPSTALSLSHPEYVPVMTYSVPFFAEMRPVLQLVDGAVRTVVASALRVAAPARGVATSTAAGFRHAETSDGAPDVVFTLFANQST